MKILPVLIGTGAGALVGLFSSIGDGIGLQIVLMSVGAVFGTAMGAAILRPRHGPGKMQLQEDCISDIGNFLDDGMATYWRDKGKIYPMSGHPDPEGATGEAEHWL